jgi:hypothetical protein
MSNLSSFRELLLRKTDDENLRALIKMCAEDVIADRIIESLEKMARHDKSDGKSIVNDTIRKFGDEMDPDREPAMIREALGHHASRYKAALESGNQSLANKHAKQFFKTLYLVDRAQPHCHGKLHSDIVCPRPWEQNLPSKSETFAERIARDPEYAAKNNPVASGGKKPNGFVNGTDGLRYSIKGSDWSFLQGPPHPHYANETAKTGHTGAYPMENTKINGKYIPIEPVENIYDGKFNHPFDHHPIMSHFADAASHRTPERDAQFAKELADYYNSEHMYAHAQHQEDLMNSGQFEQRGSRKGDPVHTRQPSAAPSQAPQETPAKTIRRSKESAISPTGEIDMSKLSPAARAFLEKR